MFVLHRNICLLLLYLKITLDLKVKVQINIPKKTGNSSHDKQNVEKISFGRNGENKMRELVFEIASFTLCQGLIYPTPRIVYKL